MQHPSGQRIYSHFDLDDHGKCSNLGFHVSVGTFHQSTSWWRLGDGSGKWTVQQRKHVACITSNLGQFQYCGMYGDSIWRSNLPRGSRHLQHHGHTRKHSQFGFDNHCVCFGTNVVELFTGTVYRLLHECIHAPRSRTVLRRFYRCRTLNLDMDQL